MDIRVQFGLSMQRIRRERGLSQEDLAGLTDIDRGYVGRLERGEGNPTLLMLARVAGALGVTLSDLLLNVKIASQTPEGPEHRTSDRRTSRR